MHRHSSCTRTCLATATLGIIGQLLYIILFLEGLLRLRNIDLWFG